MAGRKRKQDNGQDQELPKGNGNGQEQPPAPYGGPLEAGEDDTITIGVLYMVKVKTRQLGTDTKARTIVGYVQAQQHGSALLYRAAMRGDDGNMKGITGMSREGQPVYGSMVHSSMADAKRVFLPGSDENGGETIKWDQW